LFLLLAIESLNDGVLGWLTSLDESDLAALAPLGERHSSLILSGCPNCLRSAISNFGQACTSSTARTTRPFQQVMRLRDQLQLAASLCAHSRAAGLLFAWRDRARPSEPRQEEAIKQYEIATRKLRKNPQGKRVIIGCPTGYARVLRPRSRCARFEVHTPSLPQQHQLTARYIRQDVVPVVQVPRMS
jgi:hypothetical protein